MTMVIVTTVGLTHPTVGGNGGSAAAPAPCGFVSEPTHPYAGYSVDLSAVTTIKPKLHDKPKFDDNWK